MNAPTFAYVLLASIEPLTMAEGSRGAMMRDGLVSVAQAAPQSEMSPKTSGNRGM